MTTPSERAQTFEEWWAKNAHGFKYGSPEFYLARMAYHDATEHTEQLERLNSALDRKIEEFKAARASSPAPTAEHPSPAGEGPRGYHGHENWEPHRGQYVWVEGKLTETQPTDFPKRLRVYVHGVGIGIAERVKPVVE